MFSPQLLIVFQELGNWGQGLASLFIMSPKGALRYIEKQGDPFASKQQIIWGKVVEREGEYRIPCSPFFCFLQHQFQASKCSKVDLFGFFSRALLNLTDQIYHTFQGDQFSLLYTNSLVNADLFYANFTNTSFQKIPIPHLTCTMTQKVLH